MKRKSIKNCCCAVISAFLLLGCGFVIQFAQQRISNAELRFSDTLGHWARYSIDYLTNRNVIKGYQDGSFQPEKNISRQEAAALFANIVNAQVYQKTIQSPKTFTDLSPNAWSYHAIMLLADAGYISGDPSGMFRPEDSITRQEFASIVYKMMTMNRVISGQSNRKSFNDINQSYAKDAIELLGGLGIISGYSDGSFRPDNRITRSESAALLINFFHGAKEEIRAMEEADKARELTVDEISGRMGAAVTTVQDYRLHYLEHVDYDFKWQDKTRGEMWWSDHHVIDANVLYSKQPRAYHWKMKYRPAEETWRALEECVMEQNGYLHTYWLDDVDDMTPIITRSALDDNWYSDRWENQTKRIHTLLETYPGPVQLLSSNESILNKTVYLLRIKPTPDNVYTVTEALDYRHKKYVISRMLHDIESVGQALYCDIYIDKETYLPVKAELYVTGPVNTANLQLSEYRVSNVYESYNTGEKVQFPR